jgi:hypothetical protein
MFYHNQCQLVGELQEKISLQKTNHGLPYVEFYLKMPKIKTHEKQSFRCICRNPHAQFIAEKFHQGDHLFVKGSLDTVIRCFEEGYMIEVTILVKQCYLFNQTMIPSVSF